VKPIRVIQWGTGNVGTHSLRGIVERSDMELVGLRVYNADKVGRDAGSFIGRGPTGVIATDDVERLFATPADCVVYNALAETMPGGEPVAVAEICRLLQSGKNVVSTGVSHHIHPRVAEPRMRSQIEAACDAGGTTFFSSGVNPGYAFDLWPIVMTHLSRRIDRLVCSEYCDMTAYTSASAMAFMGFGLAPEVRSLMEDAHADPYRSAYYASMLLLGDALGVHFDSVTFRREVATAPDATVTPAGIYPAGTVVATRLIFTAHVSEVPRIEFRVIWRVRDDVEQAWGSGDGIWTVDIEGDPDVRCSLDVRTSTDSGRAVSITTAMHPLNAVPAVVRAPAGFVSHLDLPLYSGGWVATSEK